MKDIIYSKLQKQRESITRFERIMKKSQKSYTNEEYYQVETLIKILDGIRDFVDQQLNLGENSIFVKLRSNTNSKLSDSEYIIETMKTFKSFCLPTFLYEGDIHAKIFHEKLTASKRNLVI